MTDYYVLHSGGIDSTTTLALALNRSDARRVTPISISYGQRHIRELDAAQHIHDHYGLAGITLDLTGYGQSVTSALTTDQPIPRGAYDEETMGSTEVPARNAVFLSAAAGIAASLTTDDHPTQLVTAVHGGDHHLYPDCRPDFIHAMNQALHLATGVTLWTPLLHMTKTEIITTAHQHNTPLHLTWSCYEGGTTPCGECGTCHERAQAFHEAGLEDHP